MKLTIQQWDILRHGYWSWLLNQEDDFKLMVENDPDSDNTITHRKILFKYRAVLTELNNQVIG